jgi:hypothetical protein
MCIRVKGEKYLLNSHNLVLWDHIISPVLVQMPLLIGESFSPASQNKYYYEIYCSLNKIQPLVIVLSKFYNGECRMESVEWRVSNGECRMESVEWRVSNGECRMESVEWRVSNRECRMESVE